MQKREASEDGLICWDDVKTRLPSVATAATAGGCCDSLVGYLSESRDVVLQRLQVCGAVLFRGWALNSAEELEKISNVLFRGFASYAGGNSPRTQVSAHVFTSTEYPSSTAISMHNEASYLLHMPRLIQFLCVRPADKDGQTPLADCRRVLKRIEPQIVDTFREKGVLYVNNLHGGKGIGKSWMETFSTQSRTEVEAKLRADGYAFKWRANGGLTTSMKAASTLRHPETGEEAWINQAEQWHPSSLGDQTLSDLLTLIPEDELPHNAFLGDGSPIDEKTLKCIRDAMTAEQCTFEWKAGDLLLCDNVLVMHGRQSYSGPRKILVSMG